MRHRDLIAAIARHLPHRTQRDVEEVIDVLIELMQDELVKGEGVSLPDIGKLSIEIQTVRVSGAVRRQLGPAAPPTMKRLYGRFRPAQSLRDRLEEEQKK
jgi:nucleoid DNA-binding protein